MEVTIEWLSSLWWQEFAAIATQLRIAIDAVGADEPLESAVYSRERLEAMDWRGVRKLAAFYGVEKNKEEEWRERIGDIVAAQVRRVWEAYQVAEPSLADAVERLALELVGVQDVFAEEEAAIGEGDSATIEADRAIALEKAAIAEENEDLAARTGAEEEEREDLAARMESEEEEITAFGKEPADRPVYATAFYRRAGIPYCDAEGCGEQKRTNSRGVFCPQGRSDCPMLKR